MCLLTHKKLKECTKNYSLGERKRLSVICAILRKPKYLILDETSNGLDIDSMEILQQQLMLLKEISSIFATGHHFEFYNSLVDNLLILNNRTIHCVDEYRKGSSSLYELYKKYINN